MEADHYTFWLDLTIDAFALFWMTEFHFHGVTLSAERAAGTFVEVEGVGVCKVDPTLTVNREDTTLVRGFGPPDLTLSWEATFNLPRVGRNLVLIASADGDQVFDHWEGRCHGPSIGCDPGTAS